MTAETADLPGAAPAPATAARTFSRAHGAAAVRIGFGLIWAIDASFKWLPGFIHGQTLGDELGKGETVHTPVLHQWLQMWHSIGTSAPTAFAVGTAVIETLIALGLVLGVFSRAVFIGSAVFSLGIWSSAEAFHLPWTKDGITDLGPSVAYIFASLALYFAASTAVWSLDPWVRRTWPRLSSLTSEG
ncbi:DoxX family protein [Actinacidiphila sp. ITFR-21]|uniref:DoxX family protein n=1 Tax=Actinacidiphila sp. ITFR-21 TaxID=3075199 RepID=UPI00288C0DE8|nr:DoxX family protein [Streptomyces sp. ITFR-21]WNI16521.1 DoxX family protein [Streptomyces sp. ITFR-21]